MAATAAWRGSVEPDFGQFYLRRAGASWASHDVPGSAFGDALWSNGTFVYVATFRKYGTTTLEIAVQDDHPGEPSSDWQHVAEISLEAGGPLEIFDWDGDEPIGVAAVPDVPVRLRVHWAGLVPGRFEGLDDAGDSEERLAIAIWPSPTIEPTVLRRWHGWV